MNKSTFFLVLFLCLSSLVSGQEGLAPLWGNEQLQLSAPQKSSSRALENVTYQFTIDTMHLPFQDDFSTNLFKRYDFDTANTVLDTFVWVKFLVNGNFQFEFEAMDDTSYTYPFNGTSYDSVPNPPSYIVFYSPDDYQVPIDTDTVWVRPDTIFVGGSVITNHPPDTTYYNTRDSVIVVPDIGKSLWQSHGVLHNYTYSVNPITLGVATFDGLDSNGIPYDPTMNPNSYQIADILESKPLYLSTKEGGGNYSPVSDTSIWFSFYYQPQGLGDSPEPDDSLVLQFYSPFTKKWTTQWKQDGGPVKGFSNVSINIRNPIYFQDGFKFRFLNYASVSGNFDHWNIDYVRLDELRSAGDSTAIDDVALLDAGQSLLKEYSQMPWSHYQASTTNLMTDKTSVRYRNLWDQTTIVTTSFHAYDDGNMLFSGSLNTTPIVPSFSVLEKEILVSNSYPTTGNDTVKSFHVKYWIQPGSDTNTTNDTAFFHQQFGTQYAYDDGSAESAYFVTSAGAAIAVEYTLAKPDSLRAINIYFPRSFENILDRTFRLTVWESLSPEKILYSGLLEFPVYAAGRDLIQGIKLDAPLAVQGTIYIGIVQTDERIFIGFDQNNDSQSKNFYRISGQWSNTSYPGSLFIRPEFGLFTNPWPVSVEEQGPTNEFDFNLYPNPANDQIHVDLGFGEYELILRSILGVQIQNFRAYDFATISTSHLPSGMYVLEVFDPMRGQRKSKKLLIQH